MSDCRVFARTFDTTWGQVLARVATRYLDQQHQDVEPRLVLSMWFDEVPGEVYNVKMIGDPFADLLALTPEQVEEHAAGIVESAALWVGGVDGKDDREAAE
jgi:hypothetical protein